MSRGRKCDFVGFLLTGLIGEGGLLLDPCARLIISQSTKRGLKVLFFCAPTSHSFQVISPLIETVCDNH